MAASTITKAQFDALALRVKALEDFKAQANGRIAALESRPLPVDYSAQMAALDARLRALESQIPHLSSAPQLTFCGQIKVS